MGFVTEKISPQDVEKYNLLEVNKSLHTSDLSNWTIDRERDIYLRYISYDWQNPSCSEYSFYWKGNLLRIDLNTLSYKGEQGGPMRQTWEVISLSRDGHFWLPQDIESLRVNITSDLKEALLARGGAEIQGHYTSYIPTFTF
ncbi:hypothetical protein [Rhodoferax saidenbachensis]|nr:hypothetical protein [Rhodoferax saidenbachensis]